MTKVHDYFLVDLEKWVDLYELVRHNGKLARVMKVTGPLVTLKYRGRTYETTFTVMDWSDKLDQEKVAESEKIICICSVLSYTLSRKAEP